MEFRQDLFQFHWAVCEDGYKQIGNFYDGKTDYLEPVSTNWRRYEPAAEYPDLFLRFLNLPNEEGAARQFTNEFGSLGLQRHGADTGQSIVDFLKHHLFLSEIMEKVGAGRFDDAYQSIVTPNFTTKMDLGVSGREGGNLRYYVVPESLVDYINFQLLKELSGEIEWRHCANPKCDKTFPIAHGRNTIAGLGVGTVRKQSCGSAACRKAVTRMRQQEKQDNERNKGA